MPIQAWHEVLHGAFGGVSLFYYLNSPTPAWVSYNHIKQGRWDGNHNQPLKSVCRSAFKHSIKHSSHYAVQPSLSRLFLPSGHERAFHLYGTRDQYKPVCRSAFFVTMAAIQYAPPEVCAFLPWQALIKDNDPRITYLIDGYGVGGSGVSSLYSIDQCWIDTSFLQSRQPTIDLLIGNGKNHWSVTACPPTQ